jgi:hypothetical protein
MRYIILIVIVLSIFTYFKLSIRPNPNYTIIQCPIDKCTPLNLIEKLPVVIETEIVSPQQLINTLFRFQYIKQVKRNITEGINKDGFLLIYAKENCNVFIKHPTYTETVNIKLYKHQILIVPILWHYKIIGENTEIIGLETIISKFI